MLTERFDVDLLGADPFEIEDASYGPPRGLNTHRSRTVISRVTPLLRRDAGPSEWLVAAQVGRP